MVGDLVVRCLVRWRFCSIAVGALSTPSSTAAAAVQHDVGSTRRRTDPHRAGTARYPAAKFSGIDAPLSNRCRDASGTPLWMRKRPSKALSIGRIKQSAKGEML